MIWVGFETTPPIEDQNSNSRNASKLRACVWHHRPLGLDLSSGNKNLSKLKNSHHWMNTANIWKKICQTRPQLLELGLLLGVLTKMMQMVATKILIILRAPAQMERNSWISPIMFTAFHGDLSIMLDSTLLSALSLERSVVIEFN